MRGLYSNTRVGLKAAAAVLLLQSVSATTDIALAFKNAPCMIIGQAYGVVNTVGPALILVMMFYAVAKYAYSADDPGGRKQAKTIFIHAIIAGMFFALVAIVFRILETNISWLFKAGNLCSGVTL